MALHVVRVETGDIMTTPSLSDFFREKRAHAGENVDWEQKKIEWIAAIEELYKVIVDDFLATAIAGGSVSVGFRPKSITEDLIGTYEVRELVVRVGDETVVFSPKGRNIVSTSGRVDLKGEMGEATLVLLPGPRWSLVAQRVPAMRLVPLDEQSLLSALKDVMRP
jgi:hypothetical protein